LLISWLLFLLLPPPLLLAEFRLVTSSDIRYNILSFKVRSKWIFIYNANPKGQSFCSTEDGSLLPHNIDVNTFRRVIHAELPANNA
jgi:hypothetical protein